MSNVSIALNESVSSGISNISIKPEQQQQQRQRRRRVAATAKTTYYLALQARYPQSKWPSNDSQINQNVCFVFSKRHVA
jgi:hypothetical protein